MIPLVCFIGAIAFLLFAIDAAWLVAQRRRGDSLFIALCLAAAVILCYWGLSGHPPLIRLP